MKKRFLLVILAVLIILAAAFVIWASGASPATMEAKAALSSDNDVSVTVDPWLVFKPTGAKPTTGLIFYPGGKVDPKAYSPAAHQIASQGYLVVIVPMPLNLAVFDINKAEEVIAAYPDIQHWAIGGHSLGGAMACQFASTHLDQIDGLVLWAAYPASSTDLSGSGLKVVSIYGSQDGLATSDKIDASLVLLPAGTTWVEIQGGNHAQMGYYGTQSGDSPASISRAEQQKQVVEATEELLAGLSQ